MAGKTRGKGKYAAVVSNLPLLPAEDASYQDRVEAVKARIREPEPGTVVTHTPESLAKLYATARRAKAQLEQALSECQLTVTALEQMLVESNDSDEPGWGLYGAPPSTVKLASGDAVRVEYEPDAKVEDKEAFRLWCIAQGLEKNMHLWPTTTKALVKERLVAGVEEPPGVKAYCRPKVKFLGVKSAASSLGTSSNDAPDAASDS